MFVLGFDPGGINNFGWAALDIEENGRCADLKTGVVSTAREAVQQAKKNAGINPAGVGIDAPLFWVQEGDRRADAFIRRRVVAAGGHSGTVSSVNSLRGACLVQGILTACLAAESWPSAVITEAHPKALLRIHNDARGFVAENLLQKNLEEHERDAALAAFSAWAAVVAHPAWHNLALAETAPFFPGGKPLTYWFPK